MAVALDDSLGSLESVFATDSISDDIAALEFSLGEGPAHDALREGVPITTDDLDSADARNQWPLFSAQATAAGVSVVHAFPVRPFGLCLGAVSFLSKTPGALSRTQHRNAVSVTELIGLSLIAPDVGEVIGLGLRMSVHQAAGMVMQQTGLSIIDALVLLKATAFTEDLRVDDLATQVVAGARRFPQMEPDHGPE